MKPFKWVSARYSSVCLKFVVPWFLKSGKFYKILKLYESVFKLQVSRTS